MELAVVIPGQGVSTPLEVSDSVFNRDFNEALIHQVVIAHLAKARAGTKAQKTRGEVSGGGRKPWRQKGTGRARAGTIRSPLWRKGGKIFAAKPQNYSQKVNKKMYRSALRSMISELIRTENLIVIDDIKIEEPKTKFLIKKLALLNLDDVLIITDDLNTNLYLASRNLPLVEVRSVKDIDPICLINFNKIVVTVSGIKKLEELLG